MPNTDCNGISMYYEVHGTGSPLIVIWGIGGEILSFIDLLKLKAYGLYKIIHYDTRGTGRSGKPDHEYSIEMMADDTACLMDSLKIKTAHILGISTGSRIALSLASRYPKSVKSLILHVAAARSPGPDEPEALEAYDRLYNTMIMPGFMEKALLFPPTIPSFKIQFNALVTFNSVQLLPLIHAPTLIINTTTDRSTSVSMAQELHEGISHSQLILLEGDHMIARKDPDLILDHIMVFLKRQEVMT
ncbi:alpha/beta hydrolase [uncultured Methanospirillum sp.]|uniref:alpha/beta fold hydrolase n=1 Tax=uncultured Methanospirillum sp. TaxID=262503 RepID=UPI0029C999BE|nr:alpha/beta hydrolase [uncultured Methanospirillum sp.]